MRKGFATAVDNLVQTAPAAWLTVACETLRRASPTALPERVLQDLPDTTNSDLYFLAKEVVEKASGNLSWEAVGWALCTASVVLENRRRATEVELLWSGPDPAGQIPARRIDQALYDLVAAAQHEILLITFAAVKIERLAKSLMAAAGRGIRVRLVLEFEEASGGQLSFDALNAFPPALAKSVEVFFWPLGNREKNQSGKPGKLHAKAAVIDDVALISSANLTDDAFNRNLEIGVALKDPAMVSNLRMHIDNLITSGILVKWGEKSAVSEPMVGSGPPEEVA